MDEDNILRQLSSLKRQIWILALLIIGATVFSVLYKPTPDCSHQEIKDLIASYKDTSQDENVSMDLLRHAIIANKRIEDSLQTRIDNTLDSLEILEDKLRFMQENSSISMDIIISVADSIDTYRKQTEKLKQEIERINKENDRILHQERENNAQLKGKIESYERRLMAMFAINLQVVTYSDGFDENNKIVTTNKARKVNELVIAFKLSRDSEKEDELNIEIVNSKNEPVLKSTVKESYRNVKKNFKINSSNQLSPDNFYVLVYHKNNKYGIPKTEIGRGYISLE